MKNILRPSFYIIVGLISIVLIQSQKSMIIKSKESTPVSVLGILQSEGAPVETYKVVVTDVMQYMRKTIEKCGSDLCFYVTQIEKNNLNSGDPVFNEDADELMGSIASISGVDSTTGLSKVNVLMKGDLNKEKVKFSIVSIGINKIKNILAVPTNSIEYDTNSAFVWLYNEGKPEKRAIKTGVQSILLTEVKSGLVLGDVVVSKGQGLLHLYEKARVVKNLIQK